ncbi:MAG: stringent starvation protein SspA [Arsenophonus sp.]|nr:MAG: stringent starvation protein SspA [Arsenophonus sp.]
MPVAANKRSVITLFSGENDIFSHQVRIVLAEKDVNFEIENVDKDNLPQDFVNLNPYQTIPTLVDRELILYNARVIMEYLDERFPHPPLMPVYPVARGNTRLMMYRIAKDWYSLMYKIQNKDSQSYSARKKLKEELISISPIFQEMRFFMSEEFSLVDCCLAPFLWRLPAWNIDIPQDKGTEGIRSYMNNVFDRDSFLTSLTEAEREMRFIKN